MTEYKTIQDIQSKLSGLTKAVATKRAVNLLDTADLTTVQDAAKIISKYSSPDWTTMEYLHIQADVIVLQSILVQLAIKFGDLMGVHDTESATLSSTRSKIRLDAKKAKKELEEQGEVVKITADDVKDLSYVMTEDLSISSEDSKIVGNYLKFIYFAIKDQVQLLEKAVARLHLRGEQ